MRTALPLVVICIVCGTLTLFAPLARADFIRGDANDDATVDIADVVSVLSTLFVPGAPTPVCEDPLDGNDDGVVDISDAIYIASALFAFGPPIPPPFPDAGSDPTPDDLVSCGAGSGTSLAWEVLVEGGYSGYPAPCESELYLLALHDQAELDAFWSEHVVMIPPPPAPVVDFDTHDVIVVLLSASTSGYGVALNDIVEYGDHVDVVVTTSSPAPGCIVLMVCTAPHLIVTVPKLTTSGPLVPVVTPVLVPCP